MTKERESVFVIQYKRYNGYKPYENILWTSIT